MYYPNAGEWSEGDGGQLVLWPRETGKGGEGGEEEGSSGGKGVGSRRREIAPVGGAVQVELV